MKYKMYTNDLRDILIDLRCLLWLGKLGTSLNFFFIFAKLNIGLFELQKMTNYSKRLHQTKNQAHKTPGNLEFI